MTSLLSDPNQVFLLNSSLNSALELAQEHGLNLQAISHALDEARDSELSSQLKAQVQLTQQLLQLPAGSSAVVTNGRVVVVNSAQLGLDEEFGAEDFDLLVSSYKIRDHSSNISPAHHVSSNTHSSSEASSHACCLCALTPACQRASSLPMWQNLQSFLLCYNIPI